MSYGDDRPRGLNLRIVAGLLIALIGVAMYMMRTEVNPVTGEKQHIAMSVDQEMAIGLQAAPEMAAQMGGAVDPDRSPQARLVEEVGQKIVQQSDARKSPYAENGNFHSVLLDDPKT